MGFHPNSQLRLLEQGFDPTSMLRQSMTPTVPWDSIIDFATHPSFCGQGLYPRQQTLLRLIFLETEHMTQYDLDVIEEWRTGFQRGSDIYGVQPDIWERIEYLRRRGYRRFPHVQFVLGRRASKGYISALIIAEMIGYLISLDNPQRTYGIREGKDVFCNIGATSQTQAQRHQFADVRDVVEKCEWLQPYIAETKDHQMRLRTPADLRRIANLRKQGVDIEHSIASLWVVALSASSVAARGATSYANIFDEFAFHVQGTDSTKSSDNIYEDWQPSLGQFKKDALTMVPSSPFCLEPSTRVLTDDLRWIPVGDLVVGDKVVGFDEHNPGGKGNGRCWRQAEVTETSIIQAPRYEIEMASGKRLVSTSEHLWLARHTQDYGWIKTAHLKPGDKIKTLGVDPWTTDESREAGYLAGVFDGEGHVTTGKMRGGWGFTQNPGPVLDHVQKLLADKGFLFRDFVSEYRVHKMYSLGGFAQVLRFMGSVRPVRLVPKVMEQFYGSRIYGRMSGHPDVVVAVRRATDGPVVALGTSTNTLVAEGLLSHNTKVGKFYELYTQGKVLMDSFVKQDSAGISEAALQELRGMQMRADLDQTELRADPTKLIFQGPSWAVYEDWERGGELTGHQAPFAPENDLRDEEQMRRKLHNPEKFKVEREGQFAEVMGQYLDPKKVEAIFEPVTWRIPSVLEPSPYGRFDYRYRIHVDPSKTGANFALAIAHVEDAPADQFGECWPHVIIDRLKVWRARDFPINQETGKHEIDYTAIERELDEILYTFPSTTKFSADQWNSVGFLQRLKKKYGPNIRVVEETATEKSNYDRAEKFKSAVNLGWVHSFRDSHHDDGTSLLEQECKFLSEKNGKVVKQEFGPVTTKDLYDAVSVVVTDLLHAALGRWGADRLGAHAYGSSNVGGLKSGREFERAAVMMGANSVYRDGHKGRGRAFDDLSDYNLERRRGGRPAASAAPGRTRAIGKRDRRF